MSKLNWNTITQKIISWATSNSLCPFFFGNSCCFAENTIESFALQHYLQISPKQADILILSSIITTKKAKDIIQAYEQMLKPKYIIAIGNCAICGGMFKNSYLKFSIANDILPVDISIPGCPPSAIDIEQGICKLQQKIQNNTTLG